MLQRSLASLDELDAAKETERLTEVRAFAAPSPPTTRTTIPANSLDPEVAAALVAYDSLNPF